MMTHEDGLWEILKASRTRVLFGPGRLGELGAAARAEGAKRVLVVTDLGIVAAGHVERAIESLEGAGLDAFVFDGVAENPTTAHVKGGVAAARRHAVDFIVGLGGGSSMDCAKGVNFIFTNGGEMADYRGVNKATLEMLPMIAVPTTAGTGSEAQSFALICDPLTHEKMACGDVKAACRVAILDPELTRTQPPSVARVTGMDAIAHAVETAGTTRRNDVSLTFSREAWRRLSGAFLRAIEDPGDDEARAGMLLGAHLAGAAIEHSMLGAAHACANPLTARHGIVHGAAVGVMLPHVVRFNSQGVAISPYDAIHSDAEVLAEQLDAWLAAASLPRRLVELDIPQSALPELATLAAAQWTATFNPRKVGVDELLHVYQMAYR